jgi:hypothetical protein
MMTKPNRLHRERPSLSAVPPPSQSRHAAIEPKKEKRPEPDIRETEFCLLPDGRALDLIRSSRGPSGLSFSVWQNGTVREVSQIEHASKLLIPPKIDSTIVSALSLPSTVKPCLNTGELFAMVENAIDTYVGLRSDRVFLNAAFAVMTWFFDKLSFVPYLSLCGPLEAGKTTLLTVLQCACRRAILSSSITPASLYRLTQIRPTLLIDEAEFSGDRISRDIQRLLRGGNRQGSYVLCNGKAFENFGPKVIASRVPLHDGALSSRNISIVVTPSERDLPSLDLNEKKRLSEALQPVLESYRLSHYTEASVSQNPSFLKFPPRLRDNARALSIGMLGHHELEERLAKALEPQLQSLQFDRFGEPEWVVMLALFGVCHVVAPFYMVGGITAEANRILHDNGQFQQYSPQRVGAILRESLGFSPRRRGQGFRLDRTTALLREIHSLAKDMGVNQSDMLHCASVDSGLGEPCKWCSEFGLMVDHEGRKLETIDERIGLPPIPGQ